jgi:hypothetical protein
MRRYFCALLCLLLQQLLSADVTSVIIKSQTVWPAGSHSDPQGSTRGSPAGSSSRSNPAILTTSASSI